ncbi:hypothetical protein VTJ83DRAFT_6414 [Remersonia thermophila]|uniref:Cytochrome P450 n=1 Tax=Remersonia thermophila TaxID=72144 RepID=A0ABR4D4L7_9PEZI
MLLTLTLLVCLYLAARYYRPQPQALEKWIKTQLDIANFKYAGATTIEERLLLRATENQRLRAAFGIENSLTTESLTTHKRFLNAVSGILNRPDRRWANLYYLAERLINARLSTESQRGYLRRSNDNCRVRLAELVRCVVLAVVLQDSFGLSAAGIPWEYLIIITREINEQWLRSKRAPHQVGKSALLNATIRQLGEIRGAAVSSLAGPGHDGDDNRERILSPEEVLGLLMPQYETLWRVVLLTFVTAFHYQPEAYRDAKRRIADVPGCLGDPRREGEALKLAKVSQWACAAFPLRRFASSSVPPLTTRLRAQEGLRLYPSNKHLYRSSARLLSAGEKTAPESTAESRTYHPQQVRTLAANITTLHRHPSIWGPDALAFRPSRFDETALTHLQRAAYVPFSLGKHQCPAKRGAFGERMIVTLVAGLGRCLDSDRGHVEFGGRVPDMFWQPGEGLPTGRDDMEEWAYVVWA